MTVEQATVYLKKKLHNTMKKNKTKQIIYNLFNSFSAEPITP